MKRHCVRIHNKDFFEEAQNVESLAQNVESLAQNVESLAQNVESLAQNVESHCSKCQKIFRLKKNCKRHEKNCKGVQNILECYKCHKIFNTSSAKSKHLKKCTLLQELVITNTSASTTFNNYGTINNNITIVLNLEDSECFDKTHISNTQLKDILRLIHRNSNDAKKVNMIEEYTRQLLLNPINRCIKKTNMREFYSKIHSGNNNWITKTDRELYPKLTCNIAQGLSDFITLRNDQQRMITERKLNELKIFLDFMSDEDINLETQILFKELVKHIKCTVFDITKMHI
jgi:hypothetical protein